MINAAQQMQPPAIDGFAPPPGLHCWRCEPVRMGVISIESGADAAISPDGSPFRTLSCGGWKQEGEAPVQTQPSEAEAWADFNSVFSEAATGKSRAYFRRWPEVARDGDRWMIYARVSFA